ncbi:MAG: ABC transporter ATP-binding protein [Dermatophilaceae bacterium]
MTALRVRDLHVRLGDLPVLDGVDLDLSRGEVLAVVGESGAGKSTLALALGGLIDDGRVTGSIRLADDVELVGDPRAAHEARAERVAVALQGAPFDPLLTLGEQVAAPLRLRRGASRRAAAAAAAELAAEVGLSPELLRRHPHQTSGGERRRAALAAALALDPEVLVLDEPTAGLDPVGAARLVATVERLAEHRGLAVLLVTHALAEAARLVDRVAVLYAGRVVETGASRAVLGDPAHPYTAALVGSYPVLTTTRDLRPLRGTPPDPGDRPSGCAFHPRCPQAVSRCREEPVSLAHVGDRSLACHLGGRTIRLDATRLTVTAGRGRDRRTVLHEVTLRVRAGEVVGVAGPSGSGKTTLARALAGHLAPDRGEVRCDGRVLGTGWSRADRAQRRRVQLVAQDPWESLSPLRTVAESLREAVDLADPPSASPTAPGEPGEPGEPGVAAGSTGRAVAASRDARIVAALRDVGVAPTERVLRSRPDALSGGQLQRICVARALLADPLVVVADEPTSMLDPSEQARLAVLLRERQAELGLALVLVSHDLALLRKVADHLVVLDDGRVVDAGPTERVCREPRSETARALLAAAPALPLADAVGRSSARSAADPSPPSGTRASSPSSDARI